MELLSRGPGSGPSVALLVIDMQVDFFDRHPSLSAERSRLVAGINALARAFRHAGQAVIWVRQEFEPDLSDAFLLMRRTGTRVTIAGTEGCRLVPELERLEGDRLVVKKRYSAFFRTELDELLADLGAGTLVLAGINTHACVRMTAIDAYQRDFDVIIATERVASYDDEHHRITLRYLDGIARLMSDLEIERLVTSAVAGLGSGDSDLLA